MCFVFFGDEPHLQSAGTLLMRYSAKPNLTKSVAWLNQDAVM